MISELWLLSCDCWKNHYFVNEFYYANLKFKLFQSLQLMSCKIAWKLLQSEDFMDNNWWIFEAQSKRNKEIRKTFTLNFSFTKIVGCRTIPQISCKFKSFLAFQQIINVLHIMCTNEPRSNWKQTLLKGPILLTHYNQFFISIRPKKNFNKMQNRDSTINSLDIVDNRFDIK